MQTEFSSHTIEAWFAQLPPLGALREHDLSEQLLSWLSSFEGVDSAYLLLLDPSQTQFHLAWLAFDGSLKRGDWSSSQASPWFALLRSIEHFPHIDLSLAPPLEDGFLDRYILPLMPPQKGRLFGLLVLQSSRPSFFSSWEFHLLQLFSSQIGTLLQSIHLIASLENRLTHHQQQATLEPSSLTGMIALSNAILLDARPLAASGQYNLEALYNYHQKLRDTLTYVFDEVRLSATPDALRRVQEFSQRLNLPEILNDFESLLQDSREILILFDSILSQLHEITEHPGAFEPLFLAELLNPLLSLLFRSQPRIQVQTEWQAQQPIYGQRTRLQHAFLSLFLTLQRRFDFHASAPTLSVRSLAKEERIWLQISFPLGVSYQSQFASGEELLFARHVFEEHQAHVFLNLQQSPARINLWFPSLQGSASEIPQIDHLSELPAAETPMPSSPPPRFPSSPKPPPAKLLLLGEDQRFLRSLRRAIQTRYEILLAFSFTQAIDLIDAHPDLQLIFCDLFGYPEGSLSLFGYLKAQLPLLSERTCFLVGEPLSQHASEFARQMVNRCCPRYSTSEQFESFLQQQSQLLQSLYPHS